MTKIVFFYRILPQYRLEFFEELKKELLLDDIELTLVYGKSNNKRMLRGDEIDIKWAFFLPNKRIKIGKDEFFWQPIKRSLKDVSLILVQPELKLLNTYYFIFLKYFKKIKLGFWGHGRNMHTPPDSIRNRMNNQFILKNANWWFPYTSGVKEFLVEKKFPVNKITTLHNAIDTIGINRFYENISHEEVEREKKQLGIQGMNTVIYCGAMYPGKRMDFLLEACFKIKERISHFNIIFIGSGTDAFKIKNAAEANKWIHYMGPKFGLERAIYFKISSVQLMPGAVGLAILDSFALKTPLITTNNPYHGPEIDYLAQYKNGIMTEDHLESYVDTCVTTLKSKLYLDLLDGCHESFKKYSLQNMVKNFKEGISSCLNNG